MSDLTEPIDETDRRLLRALQADATQSLDALAAEIGVSTNTCWRRVKALEARGLLLKRVALVDPEAAGLGLTVFVSVRTSDHSKAWLERFARIVKAIPEVVEFYRMAGEVDYLLKVVCRSVADYDRVYKRLIEEVEIADVSAAFAMECIKNTTELPL